MNNHLNDEQIIRYVTRTLTDTQRETMDIHLVSCQVCRTHLAEYEALQRRIHYSLLARRKQFTASSQMTFAAIAPRLKKSRRMAVFWKQSVQSFVVAATIVMLAVMTREVISQKNIDLINIPPAPAGLLSSITKLLALEPFPEYVPISLAQISGRDAVEKSNLGLLSGVQTLPARPDIPFEIGWPITTQCHHTSRHPTRIEINEINISHPVEVYLLLQGGWALKSDTGRQVGEVSLGFSSGETLETSLNLGENIRDWNLDEPAAVKTVYAEQLQEVWVGQSEDGTVRGRIDMLTIHIPDKYHNTTLTDIQVLDHSIEPWSTGKIDPCIHLIAVTVKQAANEK